MASPRTPKTPLVCQSCQWVGTDCHKRQCPPHQEEANTREIRIRRRKATDPRAYFTAEEAYIEGSELVALVDGIWRRYPLRSYIWEVAI